MSRKIHVKTAMIVMIFVIFSVMGTGLASANSIAPPTVSKTAAPTNINIAGSGVDEVTTITLTVTGAGSTTTTTVPMDVVFALDSSGSMLVNDSSGLRKTAAKGFVDNMNSSLDQAGVVSWDDNIDFTLALTSNFPVVKTNIDAVDSSGGTNINVGLSESIDVLDANTRTESSAEVIIFLSNGAGSYTSASDGGPASEAASKGYVIYSIGLGGAPAVAALTDMATATGGAYYSSPTADNLQAIFGDIYAEIVTDTIPHYVDVVEVTKSYIIDEGSFSKVPDSVNTVGGITTITWDNIGMGDGDPDLSDDETVILSFEAKSNQNGDNLDVDVFGTAVLNYDDKDGNYAGSVNIPQVQINVNAPPLADANGPYEANEGTPITFDASGSSDPDIDTLTYRWDFENDGIWDTPYSADPTATFTWNDDYFGTVAVDVYDSVLNDTDTSEVTVNNVAPVVNAGADSTINEGDTFTGSGSFTDPGSDTWTATVDYGDGSPVQALTLSGKTFDLSHVYSDDGVNLVTVTVSDDDSGIGTDTLVVTVLNVAPVVDAGANATINEGDTFTGSGSFTDPGSDTWTATVDYGDGSPVQALTLSGKTFNLSHVYIDNGVYTVTATVFDDDSGIGTDTVTVTVLNVPPTVDAGCDREVLVYDEVTFNGIATDPGINDTFEFEWDLGDGTVITHTGLGPGSATDVATHTYNVTGDYTVTLKVTDKDGGIGIDTVNVTVHGAMWLKESSISKLESSKTGIRWIDRQIDHTIYFIKKSLKDKLWVDETHLNPKTGDLVFLREHAAVENMGRNLLKPWMPKGVKGVFREVIDDLVRADEILAITALEQAKAYKGTSDAVDMEIGLAEENLKEAYNELDDPLDKDNAILRFERVWEHSQRAIAIAESI